MGAWWKGLTADVLPGPPGAPLIGNNLVFYGTIAAAVIALVLLVVMLRRRAPGGLDPEAGMGEDLASYPPPPQESVVARRLMVQGLPVRVRLAVVAPVGRPKVVEDGAVEPLLNRVVYGLGDALSRDRARVREWPLGLSRAGFIPTFFRRVVRPEPAGTPSRWVLLAGPARAGGEQFLLGLALWADEPNPIGNLAVQKGEWNELLRMEAV